MFSHLRPPTLRSVPSRPRSLQEAFEVTATTVRAADTAAPEENAEEVGTSGLVEALLDNLSAWTVIAAAIAFLYLVWATVEILSRYVGPLPKVGV
jgi:hypothetical protein